MPATRTLLWRGRSGRSEPEAEEVCAIVQNQFATFRTPARRAKQSLKIFRLQFRGRTRRPRVEHVAPHDASPRQERDVAAPAAAQRGAADAMPERAMPAHLERRD